MPYSTLRLCARTRLAALLAVAGVMLCGLVAAYPAVATPASAGTGQAERGAPATSSNSGKLRLSLPEPRGHYPVGVRSASVSDPSRIDPATGRPRRLPVSVWYPARGHADGPKAPYLSPLVQGLLEQFLGVPEGLFDIDTHARVDAHARRHVRGVIMFQPGGGALAALYTGLIVDVASRGYVVVVTDHPHDALVVEEPDGLIFEDPNSETQPLETRLLDAELVLDALGWLVPEAGKHTPVGMFGHSRGAAATPEVMFRDPRVVAGVGLDIGTILFFGDPPGEVVAAGLDRAFGTMCSLDLRCDLPFIVDFVSHLRGPHPVEQLDILHTGYTDFVVFNPEAARADPAIGQILEEFAPTGTLQSLRAGRQAMAFQRRFVARVMDRYLVKR
jgi:hypothetical protein